MGYCPLCCKTRFVLQGLKCIVTQNELVWLRLSKASYCKTQNSIAIGSWAWLENCIAIQLLYCSIGVQVAKDYITIH